MKKTLLILASVCLFIFNIEMVNAACIPIEIKSEADFAKRTTGVSTSNLTYGNVFKNPSAWGYNAADEYQMNYLRLVSAELGSVPVYCRKPGISANVTSANQTFCVNDELLTSGSAEKKAYDAGMINILENGYQGDASSSSSITDRIDYISTQLATRAYEILWLNQNSNKNGDHIEYQIYKAHLTYINDVILSDDTIQTKLKNLEEIVEPSNNNLRQSEFSKSSRTNDSGDIVSFGKWEYNGKDYTATINSKVKSLVKNGLDAAYKQATEGNASISWNVPTEKESATENSFTKTITYKIDIKNFKNNNPFVKVILDTKNVSSEVSVKLYVNSKKTGNKDVEIANNQDLLAYVDNGTGSVYVKVVFSTNVADYCDKIYYKLSLNYYDETIDSVVYSIEEKTCVDNAQNCQPLYVLYQTNTDVTKVISTVAGNSNLKDDNKNDEWTPVDICENDCLSIMKACNKNGTGSYACQVYKDKYNETCTACVSKVEVPVCESGNDTTFDISEGYSYDTETNGNLKCETESASTNVLSCVLNGEDEAGNSYKSNLVENNDYCSVFCKEDYHITLPGQKEVNSGRYFTLSASISGAKTCYTTKIDYDKFESDITAASANVQSAYNTWNASKTAANLNTLKSKVSEIESIKEKYNSCSSWTMTYDYNAKVKFIYEEEYMSLLEDKNTFESNKTISNVSTSYCAGDVNDDYTCKTSTTQTVGTKTLNVFTCEYDKSKNSVSTDSCSIQAISVADAKYISQTASVSANYITPSNFYSIYPYRTIVVSSSDVENASKLENKLPVGMGTKAGVYTYVLKVEDLGEYYNTGKLGRIWGEEGSVVDKVTSDTSRKCLGTDSSLSSSYKNNSASLNNGVYVCAYKVNCPSCPVECEPDGCTWTDCPNNGCPVMCDNCIYNNNDLNTNYRPITNEDINPNDRDLGKNWEYDDSIETGLELKAYATTEEIESDGENIYSDDYDGNVVKVTMNSKMISKIRAYNEEQEDNGGYLSNSLKCYDHVGNDGITYENVYCYSTFLDELLYDNDTKQNIKITRNGQAVTRVIGKNEEETNKLRKTKTQASGYWTTWSEATAKNTWTVTTTNELAYYQTRYGSNINIGPSWK